MVHPHQLSLFKINWNNFYFSRDSGGTDAFDAGAKDTEQRGTGLKYIHTYGKQGIFQKNFSKFYFQQRRADVDLERVRHFNMIRLANIETTITRKWGVILYRQREASL